MKKFVSFIFAFSCTCFLFTQQYELPFSCESDTIVSHIGYVLKYNEEHEQAAWVAYELTAAETSSVVDRKDLFKPDSAIPTGSASLADYAEPKYERGHLIPCEDCCWSEESMLESFLLSNMSPQLGEFNGGKWRSLEKKVRDWAQQEGSVFVATGPVLTDGPYETIGSNQVSVPKYFYKVILDLSEPEVKGIGFLMPHRHCPEELSAFAVSIDRVEQVTGINFFYLVDDLLEESLESSCDPSLWFRPRDDAGNKELSVSPSKESAAVPKDEPVIPGKYWINGANGVRHNPGCRYYGNTQKGYYTDEAIGKACGICKG